jgi:ribonuclease Z
MPDPTRAGPCSAVIVGGKVFLVDSGEGAARNLSRMGIPAGRIEAIFLTHFHSDHIDGLPPVLLQRWIGGTHTQPTPLFGPEGVEAVAAGFNAAYALDKGYRTAHHGPAVAPPSGHGAAPMVFSAEAAAAPDGVVVYNAGGLVVRAFTVDHGPVSPAVGYRFDYGGRSVVFSGDTAVSPHLNAMASGADLPDDDADDAGLVGALRRRGPPNRRRVSLIAPPRATNSVPGRANGRYRQSRPVAHRWRAWPHEATQPRGRPQLQSTTRRVASSKDRRVDRHHSIPPKEWPW